MGLRSEKEIVPEATLRAFRSLFQCWEQSGSPQLVETYVAYLLDVLVNDGFEFELQEVEQSLTILLQRFAATEMSEQARDLFAQAALEESRHKFEKASNELYAMAEFQRMGVLHSLGWPAGGTDTPPFDLRVRSGDAVVPADVKSANGSGLLLAEDAVQKIVTKWAGAHDLRNITVSLRYRGLVSQNSIGPDINVPGVLQAFTHQLNQHTAAPQNPLSLILPQVRIDVHITSNRSALAMAGGIQGSAPLVQALASIFEGQVGKKSSSALKEGGVPFVLVYVQLPGRGASDIKTDLIFQEAVRQTSHLGNALKNNANELWLGSILFRPQHPRIPRLCCLRPAAAWSDNETPQSLSKTLSAELQLI